MLRLNYNDSETDCFFEVGILTVYGIYVLETVMMLMREAVDNNPKLGRNHNYRTINRHLPSVLSHSISSHNKQSQGWTLENYLDGGQRPRMCFFMKYFNNTIFHSLWSLLFNIERESFSIQHTARQLKPNKLTYMPKSEHFQFVVFCDRFDQSYLYWTPWSLNTPEAIP